MGGMVNKEDYCVSLEATITANNRELFALRARAREAEESLADMTEQLDTAEMAELDRIAKL